MAPWFARTSPNPRSKVKASVITGYGTARLNRLHTRDLHRERIDVMNTSGEVGGEIVREALVEFEFHPRSGTISSRASAAK